MEAPIACSSSSQTLSYYASLPPVSYAERIKKRLACIATPPSSIIELPAPLQPPEEEANSPTTTTTTTTTTATSEALTGRSTAATSVPSSPKVFLVQKFYVSPSTPMDQELQDVWTEQIFDRLNQTLKVTIPTGICLQEFMHMARRPSALKPTLVINCGNVHIKRQVQKTFKKQIWLQDLLKSKGIMFVALVGKVSLSAGPVPSRTITNDLIEAYAIDWEGSNSDTLCGLSLVINVKNGLPPRRCTLGGMIMVDGKVVGLTAGHPFQLVDQHNSSCSNQVAEDLDDDANSDTSSEPFVFNEETDDINNVSSTSSLPLHMEVDSPQDCGCLSTALCDEESQTSSPHFQWQSPPRFLCSQPTNHSTFDGNTSRNSYDWALLDELPPAIKVRVNRLTQMTSCVSSISETAPSGTCGPVVINIQGDGPQSGYLHTCPSSILVDSRVMEVQLVTLERALPLGSSGAWVTLGNKLCGHIIAVRQDVPWAYMMAIRPIFDDIRSRLSIDDVWLPTIRETVLSTMVSEPDIVGGLEGERSESTAIATADADEKPVLDEPVSKPQTHPPVVESANPNNQGIEVNRTSTRPLYRPRPEYEHLDIVHERNIKSFNQALKDRESIRSQRNPLIQAPFTVWHCFERFILRTEYERRMRRSFALPRHSVERSMLSFNARPVPENVALRYLYIGLSFYRWPLGIIYYIMFFPFICLVVARHQTILVDERVLQRKLQDGILMLGTLPRYWADRELIERARLLGGVNYNKLIHDVEPPVSEMEMGRSNFELPSIRGE
ncbi:MAG: hypothetical protein Q9172_000980 [Xanthocarpia lactea]